MADEDALNRLEIAADQVASQNAAAVDSFQHSYDLVEMITVDCRHLNSVASREVADSWASAQ